MSRDREFGCNNILRFAVPFRKDSLAADEPELSGFDPRKRAVNSLATIQHHWSSFADIFPGRETEKEKGKKKQKHAKQIFYLF